MNFPAIQSEPASNLISEVSGDFRLSATKRNLILKHDTPLTLLSLEMVQCFSEREKYVSLN